MEFSPLPFTDVVQVVDHQTIATAVGVAGGAVLLVVFAWVGGFRLVGRLYNMLIFAVEGHRVLPKRLNREFGSMGERRAYLAGRRAFIRDGRRGLIDR
ncbi:MAG: hypothetical protein AAF937_09435 [Planctomycetota bacterium]